MTSKIYLIVKWPCFRRGPNQNIIFISSKKFDSVEDSKKLFHNTLQWLRKVKVFKFPPHWMRKENLVVIEMGPKPSRKLNFNHCTYRMEVERGGGDPRFLTETNFSSII